MTPGVVNQHDASSSQLIPSLVNRGRVETSQILISITHGRVAQASLRFTDGLFNNKIGYAWIVVNNENQISARKAIPARASELWLRSPDPDEMIAGLRET
jgi:hypothetical protein